MTSGRKEIIEIKSHLPMIILFFYPIPFTCRYTSVLSPTQPLRRLYSVLILSPIHEEHPVVSSNQYSGERLTRCYYAVYCVECCPRLSALSCRLRSSCCKTPISRECSRPCHQEPVSAQMHFLNCSLCEKITKSIQKQ